MGFGGGNPAKSTSVDSGCVQLTKLCKLVILWPWLGPDFE